jgi:GNAT superfamily N-acetyltransferase
MTRWDESDQDTVNRFFEIDAAGQAVDDPAGPPPSPSWLRANLAGSKGADRREVWAGADDSGRVLGWYWLRLTDRENRHVGFLSLSVHPEHRRRGIGTALLRHAAQRAAADARTVLGGEAFEGGAGTAFAKQAGARAGVLEARRLLDVTGIPAGKVAALRATAAAAAAGYSIVSWTGPVPEERIPGYAYVRVAMNDAPSD